MARPVWADRAPDPAAVAEHLEHLAATAPATLRFDDVSIDADPSILHQAALARARKQLSASHSEADRILAQEVRAVDDLVRAANLLVERLREWYALHAPEAVRLQPDAEALARLVAEHGDRATVLSALHQADLAGASLGTDLGPEDLGALQSFAASLRAVHEAWRQLEARVAVLMEQVAPNVAAAVGPVLGARLLAQAGSLQRLASYPAGTVQLLGAETALFRHLKEGTKPPKHGLLFQHAAVHQAPPWQRGAIARALAQAASVAAKADAFTQRDLRAHVQQQVRDALQRIARTRATPRRTPPGPGRDAGRGGHARGPSGGMGRRQPAGPRRDGPPGARGSHRRSDGAPAGARAGPGEGRDDRPRRQEGPPGRWPGAGRDRREGGGGDRRGTAGEGRRDDRRDDRTGKRRRGPGAFRGGGTARPPGRGEP